MPIYQEKRRASDAYRMKWRYGERGYNVSSPWRRTCLPEPECSCGVCAIAAFSDGCDGGEEIKLGNRVEFAVRDWMQDGKITKTKFGIVKSFSKDDSGIYVKLEEVDGELFICTKSDGPVRTKKLYKEILRQQNIYVFHANDLLR